MDVSLSMRHVKQRAFQQFTYDAEAHSNHCNNTMRYPFFVTVQPKPLLRRWDTDVPHFCGGDGEPLRAKAIRRTHARRHFCPIGHFCPVIPYESFLNYHRTVDIHRNGTDRFRQHVHACEEKSLIVSGDTRQRRIPKKECRIR